MSLLVQLCTLLILTLIIATTTLIRNTTITRLANIHEHNSETLVNAEVLKEIITIVTYTTQDSSLNDYSILSDLVHVVKLAETKFPKQKIYQHLTDYLRKTILAGISEGQVVVLREWAYRSSLGVDEAMKATVHLHLGLHYQTIIMLDSDSEEFFDKSKVEFKKVIAICRQSNCPNRDYLLARAYVFMAQNCYYV